MADTTARARDPDPLTRLEPPMDNQACQALSPGIGNAAAWTWLNDRGLGASTSTGTSA